MKLTATLRSAVAALTGLAIWASAYADGYPSKPIHLIVPFPPGGAQDVLARLIAEPLSAQLKQPVVVENRGGAAGNIGADVLARATPDGYTVGILSGVHTANAAFYRKLNYQLDKDFVPVKALGESAVVLAANKSVPYHDAAQFLAYAKAHPGKIQVGSTTSLTLDLLKVQTGLDIQLIPYKGIGEALQDLMGERVDVVAGPALQMLPLIKQHRIQAIGIASARRVPELPGVGTVGDLVTGYDAGMWYGLFGPKGLPPDVAATLSRDIAAILNQPDVRARLAAQGIDVSFSSTTTAQLTARMQGEIAQWRHVAEKTGNYAN